MPIPCECPGCRLTGDLDVFVQDPAWAHAVNAALRIPPALAGRTVKYLRLFVPQQKRLSAAKCQRILAELADAIDMRQIKRAGVTWAAPVEIWQVALDAVISSPPESLPLGGNEYLWQVVANMAHRTAVRDEKAGEEEAKRGRAGAQSGLQPVAQVLGELAAAAPAGNAPAPAPVPASRKPPGGAIDALRAAARGRAATATEGDEA